ncbi:MAG: hypothetical protein RSP_11600 [Rhodanobacter sp.]
MPGFVARATHRDSNRGVQLAMNHRQGHPRIVMKVAKDGPPSLQMPDADGKVTGEPAPSHWRHGETVVG